MTALASGVKAIPEASNVVPFLDFRKAFGLRYLTLGILVYR